MNKNKVYADCGHEIDRILKPNFVWDYNENSEMFISLEIICETCFLADDEKGQILSREDVREFLNEQVSITPNIRYSGDKY